MQKNPAQALALVQDIKLLVRVVVRVEAQVLAEVLVQVQVLGIMLLRRDLRNGTVTGLLAKKRPNQFTES